ncbi:Ubiquitin conjugation factor E4 A [Cichlidogyrus casuarinus]|uniref:RING-type E3 ubiquitin transferase n=1 Tax=Cichlidogyrus casuarinus TaxID=1844966 RepID=A0ABD2QEX3_9PLAT
MEKPPHLLTELFFLTHYAIHLAFGPLLSLHKETNQQLHQMETALNSRDGFAESDINLLLKRKLRDMMSRFLEQVTAMSNERRLRDQLGFLVTTTQYLIALAKQNKPGQLSPLAFIPEFVIENVIDLVSYLRVLKDEFLESSDVANIPLEPLLEFAILFMHKPTLLPNPHLRARLAELLETLLPVRENETWNTAATNVFGQSINQVA